MEQIFQTLRPVDAFFWATHNGAEIDLFFLHRGQRYGVEVKFSEAPTVTRSMRIALQDLSLHHLWIIYPGRHRYLAHEQITVWPLREVADLPAQLD